MPYQAYDLDDLKLKMEDRWDSTPFWDDKEAQNAINEALKVWNSMTGFWKTRDLVTVVAGTTLYELPGSIVFGFRVEYQSRQLTPTSTFEMDGAYPGWEVHTGSAPQKWMPIDLSTIQIYPIPTIGGGSLTVDGIAATPQLIYDVDHIQMGSDGLNAIVGYALHAVALKEGGARFDATMKYFQEFLAAAAVLNDQLTKSEMFRHFMKVDTKREEQPTV